MEKGGGGESLRSPGRDMEGVSRFYPSQESCIGFFLGLGNLVHISDEKIEIGFEKDSFHYERILEKENRSQLESICHEYLQRKVKVIISPLDQGVRSKGRVVLERRRGSSQ